ncbi:MAG: sigma-70 family RNA polymerase sigma factor [Opitutaceae bacterium]|nr:sigma-70 family RNA polymerase sigma factor [Opitutaceae bacterium]
MSETSSNDTTGTPAAQDNGATELVAAIAAGEKYALARAYDLYSRPLFGMAYRLLQNRSEAEDILHDVFANLRGLAEDYDPSRGSIEAWLIMLVRSRAIDRIRKTRRRADLVAAAAPEDLGWEESPSGLSSPANSALRNEQIQGVRAALAELPADQRQALELAYFTGLTQQEIAERLQEPLGTIKARVRRSLLRLREVIGGRHE